MNILILGGTGFIGSKLFVDLTSRGHNVDTLDLEIYGNFVNPNNIKQDYRTFDLSILDNYEAVINLCGNSSVKSCECSLDFIIDNNVKPLLRMIPYLKNKIFINASSSSVYGSSFSGVALEDNFLPNAINNYDFYKKINDQILLISNIKNYYSLRFGTVCGYSPNLRNDIMINAMYKSFLESGEVKVFSGETKRPILWIKDLCDYVSLMLEQEVESGIYNLCSFNSTSYEIALECSEFLKCELIDLDKPEIKNAKMSSSKYDFWISMEKTDRNFCKTQKGTVEDILKDLVRNEVQNSDNRNMPLKDLI
jgi:UDP-glucose 4-epimerase